MDVGEMPDRTDADEQILDLLREGARTQAYLVDETGRLQLMEARGWVENLHRQSALWELKADPDEDGEQE
jgi:hypothetical protein